MVSILEVGSLWRIKNLNQSQLNEREYRYSELEDNKNHVLFQEWISIVEREFIRT